MESNDVAAALAALKRTGKCPSFTIDITLQDAPAPAESVDPELSPAHPEDLMLADADVEFLATLGIRDPRSAPIPTQDLE